MKHTLPFLFACVICFTVACVIHEEDKPIPARGKMEYPGEWMYSQRAFPYERINIQVYESAIAYVQQVKQMAERRHTGQWQHVGPLNIGGRITDIVVHPHDVRILYVGAANGGVFRTLDGGESWAHIFIRDGKLGIGDLAISPSNPNRLYIGTGEANGSATTGAFFGDGVYRSDDGGDTWSWMGLNETHHIGRVLIHPEDPDHVLVAAMGHQYGKNPDRGVYRTTNGGESWEQVLFINDSTGIIDIVRDPGHPDTLYAAAWERIRFPHTRDYAGTGSGVYRSYDGGDTWEQAVEGLPIHEGVGRIGLAVSATGTVYAAYSEDPALNDFSGLYSSTDAGVSWSRVDDFTLEADQIYGGFGWYFGNIRVDPHDPEKVFILGLRTWRSSNKGHTWTRHTSNTVHVDHHAFEIHPLDPNLHFLGTDGGLYISKNGGASWRHIDNLPITEFYTCEIDALAPYRYYGGAQDNGTLRTLTGAADDWDRIFGGDGFYVLVDPMDNNIIYCEYQYGFLYKSTDGGFDWKYSLQGVDGTDRTNWNTPFAMSPVNRYRLYYGTHRLYTTTDGAASWVPISDDLTNTDPASPGGTEFGALSTIGLTAADSNVIYTGSEDGLVFVTFDHGKNWKRISDDLPVRYVTRVTVDQTDPLIAYVTISGYKERDYLPHIFRTDDGGETWTDISGNLPEVPLNDVLIDPDLPATLYVASDLGVWYTDNLGLTWEMLGDQLPVTAYTDLDLHVETHTLLAASYGLSMFTYDLGESVSSTNLTGKDIFDVAVIPNPAEEHVTFAFSLKTPDYLKIEVLDLHGRSLLTLSQMHYPSGEHRVHADLGALHAGVYIVRITGEKGRESKLMVRA